MCVNLTSLSHCVLDSPNDIAVYHGKWVTSEQFYAEVKKQAKHFSDLKHKQFSLYYEQAYPFCVSLFALLHSDKQIYIAANNKKTTAKQLTKLGCLLIGDWHGAETAMPHDETSPHELQPLNPEKKQITIFTSGSSGQAKLIKKSLQQFQNEIETLEKLWGQLFGKAQILATVSHQHIYGLLFRILWPLAAGRCFFSELFLSPEALLKSANHKATIWVASPAQLKRLDELTDWQQIAQLTAIVSSGGALPIETAKQIYHYSDHKLIEVYGSSETGGIGWRQSIDEELWTPFDGVTITINEEKAFLNSPYLAESETTFMLDDKIQLKNNQQFKLLGRVDRIVKIEEKRLSLDELEQELNQSGWVEQAHTLLLPGARDKIGAIIILTESGKHFSKQQGKGKLIKQLRKHLMQRFETVMLPRKWLFMLALPLTKQGKINQTLLTRLLSLNSSHFPQLLDCDYLEDTVKLQLRIQSSLVYFSGHFPQQPVLPGVTQLAWAEHFAKIFFNIELPFLRLEVIKFKKLIRPDEIIQMDLNWKPSSRKLYFQLNSIHHSHSSGRIVYGEQE